MSEHFYYINNKNFNTTTGHLNLYNFFIISLSVFLDNKIQI